MDFKAYYANQQKLVENYLKNRIAKKGISKVDEAMEYSLMAGGKRIRPILRQRLWAARATIICLWPVVWK